MTFKALIRPLRSPSALPALLVRRIASRSGHPEHNLRAWQKAVSAIPVSQIQPHSLGGTGDASHAARIKTAAYYGDRTLGAAVASAQRRRAERDAAADADGANDDEYFGHLADGISAGELTEVMSTAVSNKFLANHIAEILPFQSAAASVPGGLAKLVVSSNGRLVKEAGTMVEAAIDAVASSSSADTGSEAISNLADWLVESALRKRPGGAAKGEILDRGGSVISRRIRGRVDQLHVPLFQATARLEGRSVSAKGRSRREAEGSAAAGLLRAVSEEGDLSWGARKSDGCANLQSDEGTAPDIRSGETSEEWWRRGASQPQLAFQRISASPQLFPAVIDSVDCAVGKSGSGGRFSACVTVVGSIPPTRRVFTKHSTSRARARREACLCANGYIAREILGSPLEGQ